ncbi:hypothetical protein, partial [Pseudomonas avellanae]|uniref:hypothetical protein n=1 Tax=Pseudomonas avellanae TaxID=46257 RepID=UPI0019D3A048
EGRKGALISEHIQLTSQNRCVVLHAIDLRRTIVVSLPQHSVVPGPQSLHINESAFSSLWH